MMTATALMIRRSEIAMATISARSSRRSCSSALLRCCDAPEGSGGENLLVLKMVCSRQNDRLAIAARAAIVASKDIRLLGLPEARPGRAMHPAPRGPSGVTQPALGGVRQHNHRARTLCV